VIVDEFDDSVAARIAGLPKASPVLNLENGANFACFDCNSWSVLECVECNLMLPTLAFQAVAEGPSGSA